MGTWNVDTDEEKNRLYLSLDGHFEVEEVAEAADAVIEAAERLDPGFDEINDMSGFEPADQEAMDHIERGKRGITENGVAAVCRVVSESTTGQMQFDRAGEGEEDYQLAKTDSIEKAEKLLDARREDN
ncbi:hypothetical protein [Halorientalis salina]|uniref:hypothetical protein n=1 Tax=Halorientalis salina TaxID=2932266 RepID=UPI0010AB9238|nr:hypothetical protein [Halorientalis salina]